MGQKYGSLKFASTNIGDEIQSVAAQRFYPQIDYFMYREHMNTFSSDDHEKVKVIMNSWYMWRPENFPPSNDIDPLLISMSFADKIRDRFLTKQTRAYLKKHGPVGCRDMETYAYLTENEIPVYFSGCMTLTLNKNPELKQKAMGEEPFVLCVNVPEKVTETVRSRTNKPVYSISKLFSPYINSMDRFRLAKAVLYLYHNASVVVTTNLHTALPCLAFETPVCLLDPETYDYNRKGRFAGIDTLLHHYGVSEFLEKDLYNIDNPPENPKDYLQIRADLERRCVEFTGYDSKAPAVETDFHPTVELLNIMRENQANNERLLYWVGRRSLLKMLIRKTLKYIDRNDVEY